MARFLVGRFIDVEWIDETTARPSMNESRRPDVNTLL